MSSSYRFTYSIISANTKYVQTFYCIEMNGKAIGNPINNAGDAFIICEFLNSIKPEEFD